jgi:hypothetical protein
MLLKQQRRAKHPMAPDFRFHHFSCAPSHNSFVTVIWSVVLGL